MTPTHFFTGLAYLGAGIECAADGAVTISGSFVAAGPWTLAGGALRLGREGRERERDTRRRFSRCSTSRAPCSAGPAPRPGLSSLRIAWRPPSTDYASLVDPPTRAADARRDGRRRAIRVG